MNTFTQTFQSDYEPHDSDNINEGWEAVEEYVKGAHLIAWDTCHKIYLAMDLEQRVWFEDNYSPDVVFGSPEHLLETIKEWWDASCSLRFVSAVWSNNDDPNDGFVSLISQFATDGKVCEFCGEDETWCVDNECQDTEDDEDNNEDEEV